MADHFLGMSSTKTSVSDYTDPVHRWTVRQADGLYILFDGQCLMTNDHGDPEIWLNNERIFWGSARNIASITRVVPPAAPSKTVSEIGNDLSLANTCGGRNDLAAYTDK